MESTCSHSPYSASKDDNHIPKWISPNYGHFAMNYPKCKRCLQKGQGRLNKAFDGIKELMKFNHKEFEEKLCDYVVCENQTQVLR